MEGIFFLDKSHYKDPINPLKSYIEQLTNYIEKMKGWPFEKAKKAAYDIVRKHFKDPQMKCFERLENGDKVLKDTTVYKYIADNLKQQNIIAPTFTTYMPGRIRKSILSEFIFVSVAKRSVAKKESQRAKAEGNILLADNKNNEQNNLKTYNNSMSGAFAQEACILHNPANHSTLTSVTRTMTSLSNANNERIIAGNRYYPRGIDVLNNIIYISTYTDINKIEEAINTFGLHIPTVRETVQVLKYSSDLYFFDNKYYQEKIIPYLEKLSPYQLASICYSGDFYHLRKFNSDFVRNLLETMCFRIDIQERDPEVVGKIHKVDENIINFVHHIFFKELKGRGKVYGEIYEKVPLLVESIYHTCKNVEKVLMNFKLFFNTFFMHSIMPCNSFRLKNMRRRTVVLSDTDSTCFTLDEWVKWYGNGEFHISDKTIAIGGAISYITTQAIVNLLRVLSANMGVDPDLIDKLGMKNEFLWLIHVPAEVSKHYYAYTVLQETSVLGEPEIEIKGVHLKNSAVAKIMIDDGKRLMKDVLEKLSNNKKIKLQDIVEHVIRLEDSIIQSVYKGESSFLKKSKIKSKDAYIEEPAKSPFGRHLFWNEVFGLKYGDFPPPPYDVVKIPTIVKTKTALLQWLASIEDVELRTSLQAWLNKNNKTKLPTIYLNDGYVLANGIPKEIISIIDIHRIVLDVTIQHRAIIETLGMLLYKEKMIKEQFNFVPVPLETA